MTKEKKCRYSVRFCAEDCDCCSAKEYCDQYAERKDGADNE
jgi:hypothetical protein